MKPLSLILAGLIAAVGAASAAAQDAADRVVAQAREPAADGPRIGGEPAPPVESGYLGIKADDSGPGDGIRLLDVISGAPAEKAGLCAGDLITAVQGEAVRSVDQFAAQLGRLPAGAKVTFTLLRGDERQSIDVTLGRRQQAARPPQLRLGPALPAAPATGAAPLGLRVQPVSEEAARRLALPAARGAQVTMVSKDSAADKAGIAVDGVIVSIDGQDTESPDDAAKIIGAARAGQTLKFALYERGQLVERAVTVARGTDADPSRAAAASGTTPPPRTAVRDPLPGGPAPPTDVAETAVVNADDRVKRLEGRIEQLEKRLEAVQRRLDEFLDLQQRANDLQKADKLQPRARLIPQTP